MKRLTILAVIIGALAIAAPAQASPLLTGGISVTMNYVPACGEVDCSAALNVATGLDFLVLGGVVGTPGVAGSEVITSANGDFAFLVPGTIGQIKDFTYRGAGNLPFPSPTIIAWETFGGLTFDMTSVVISFESTNSLVLDGTGIFNLAGFDPTPGTWTLSTNTAGGTFSASASKAAVPDPGSSLLLMGLGLVGLRMWKKR